MRIRGVELHIRVTGQGTPFLWGHGLTSSMAGEDALDWFRWGTLTPGIQLVRYDARGHGQSEPGARPEDYHWRNLAEDMLALADAVGARRFIAGGASMGCATALYAALRAPERVKALVLVIPPTAWEARAAQAGAYRQMAVTGGVLGGRLLARQVARRAAQVVPSWMPAPDAKQTEALAQNVRGLRRGTLWNLFRGAALTNLPPREAFQALADIPTLLLAWTGDPAHPVSTAEELHRLLPRSQLVVAQNTGEFATLPQRMRDFLGTVA